MSADRRPAVPAPPPPHVLREYALVADGERGALVGPRGEVAWLCAPQWDSPAVFSSLVGGRGSYQVHPEARCVWGGSYEEGSLVWRSRWTTDDGAVVECREALALPGAPDHLVLLRRVRVLRGAARVRVRLEVRADDDRHGLRDPREEGGAWTGRAGGLAVRWRAGAGVRAEGPGSAAVLALDLDLRAGEERDLVLELAEGALPAPVPADGLWSATEAAWAGRVPDLAASWAPRQAQHSAAVLHGLTSSSGAMVAAATTALPERAGTGRDYDYRFAWVRDQCYAGSAAFTAACPGLGDSAVRFVTERLLADGPRLAPAYTTRGEPVPPPHRLGLPGYPGGGDAAGNQVRSQFQLDTFGECLQLLATALRADRLDEDGHRAAAVAVSAVAQRWQEPDAGVWELAPAWWTHSRLAVVAGLRAWAGAHAGSRVAAAGAGRALGAGHEDVLALADEVLAETARRATHPSGRWQRAADDERVDAALVLGGLRGAVPADDPRHLAAVAAVQAELQRDGHTFRFRHDARPLGEAEGSFALCDFWLVLVEAQAGQRVAAAARMERALAACGPPGLFSEEFDVEQRQLRGNLPQAFVHALALEACARLPDMV